MIKGYKVKQFLWMIPSIVWAIYYPTLFSVGVACFFTGTSIMQVLYGKMLDDAREVVSKAVDSAEDSHQIANKSIHLSKLLSDELDRTRSSSDIGTLAEYENELLRRKNLN